MEIHVENASKSGAVEDFCCELSEKSEYYFKKVVDEILLLRLGNIVKFFLSASKAHLSSDSDIDSWVNYLTSNAIKELTLYLPETGTNIYKLPNCIFHCTTLTHLTLSSCVFKLPTSFLGFPNLVTLKLSSITFVPTSEFCVIKAPLLTKLNLLDCDGLQYLDIVPLGLKSFSVCDPLYFLVLNCFMNCKDLRDLVLEFPDDFDTPNHDEKPLVEKLLLGYPRLEELHLNAYIVELLSGGAVLNGLPFAFNCLSQLSMFVDFNRLGSVSVALQLVMSCHNLRKFTFGMEQAVAYVEEIVEYLITPSACLAQPHEKLEHVCIYNFQNSKIELLFAKFLLSCTPYLQRMFIAQGKDIGMKGERDTIMELTRFP